ncbi:MAG: hypothetical protein ACMUJM_24925 [bacterium]
MQTVPRRTQTNRQKPLNKQIIIYSYIFIIAGLSLLAKSASGFCPVECLDILCLPQNNVVIYLIIII